MARQPFQFPGDQPVRHPDGVVDIQLKTTMTSRCLRYEKMWRPQENDMVNLDEIYEIKKNKENLVKLVNIRCCSKCLLCEFGEIYEINRFQTGNCDGTRRIRCPEIVIGKDRKGLSLSSTHTTFKSSTPAFAQL